MIYKGGKAISSLYYGGGRLGSLWARGGRLWPGSLAGTGGGILGTGGGTSGGGTVGTGGGILGTGGGTSGGGTSGGGTGGEWYDPNERPDYHFTAEQIAANTPGEMEWTVSIPSDKYYFAMGRLFEKVTDEYPEIEIDWGDKSKIEQFNISVINPAPSHTYAKAGTYYITIKGAFRFGRGDGSNSPSLRDCLTSIVTQTDNSPICDLAPYAFSHLEHLTYISPALLIKCSYTKNFDYCFSNCKRLTSVPPFFNCLAAESFFRCFEYCSNLARPHEYLFAYSPNAKSFEQCFYYAGIVVLPATLFRWNTKAQNFNSCFAWNQQLSSIPQGFFDANIAALDFGSCFMQCTGLRTAPEDLFTPCRSARDFSQTFLYCNLLAHIPPVWNTHPNAAHQYYASAATAADNWAEAYEKGWTS